MTALPAISQVIVHTTDFIPDGSRTAFNGFEALSKNTTFERWHVEGGIKVEHVGPFRDVWTASQLYRNGFDGERSWYITPHDSSNPSNNGYERVTLTSGANFGSVGLLTGSGFGGYCTYDCDAFAPYLTLYFELLEKGTSVASGSLAHHPSGHYVGFSGVAFDEIRLWDRTAGGWPGQSAIILDSIEVTAAAAVPEPATYALALAGLAFVGAVVRRRSRS